MADADFSIKAIISAQTSQFEKGIKNAQSSINSMSKSIEGVQKLLKSAFSVVGIGMSIKAVTDFGKTCAQSASQAQKAFSILDNTVKATGADAWTSTKQLEASSKELSDSTNYSVTEIQKAQSVLLGFTNITGEAFDEASSAVLDMATVMGMNLTSAVQTIGKALDDPITGLDSLRRQGFKFTDEQKAELTQLVKNGKQLEAQKIILDTLATSYGGAAKAGQDSFAKQRHAMENFTDTLGGKLIPVFKVFAENSAKTLNHLTDIISKMDFTPIVNVVSNLSRVFSSAFSTISNYLKDVKNEVTDFISRFNFQPIISILDTLAGVFITVFSKIKSSLKESSNTFNNVKESLIEFSHSETFQKIADTINLIIDALVFLWEEVEKIVGEIRTFVVNKVINIWNKIKELFQNSQNALSESTGDIKSWGDYFYKIFNNCFRVVQDLIYGVSNLLKGNWEVAWEYAKLVVLRLVDSVATSLETIKTTFKDKMKTMLTIASTAVGVVGGPMGKALQLALKGIEAITTDPLGLVRDAGNKIEEMVSETEARIEELTKKPADTALSDLNRVSEAFAGFTSNALGNIQDLTEGTEEATAKQKHHFQSTASTGEKTYKKFSEWDIKLLQQRLEDLDEWSDEYSRINVELIEQERKKALEADSTGAETEKINKFYNKKIEKENKRSLNARLNLVKNTISKITSFVKNMISTIKSIISKGLNLFKSLVNINTDDLLTNMLEFEDKILTFFVDTLPQLPAFFKSALQSISVLLQNVLNIVTPEKIANIMMGIVNTIIEYIPQIINLASGLISSLLDGIVNSTPQIMSALETLVVKLAEDFPKFLQKFIDLVIAIFQNPDKIANMVVALIKGIVEVINVLLRNIRPLLQAILPAIGQIIVAIIKAIPDILVGLGSAIWESVKEIGKFIVNLVIDALNGMFDTISKAWTWIPGTQGIPHIPHLMNGTDNASRGLTLVGEAGPELVYLHGGERVLNNKNTQKLLGESGGNTNSFNITFNNLQDTSAYAMMKQLKQYQRQMAFNGIL